MSETVRYTGKLKLVEKLNNETLEEQCERILRLHDYEEIEIYYDSWEEMIYGELDNYVVYNGNVYEVIEKNKKSTDFDIFVSYKNMDNTISYEVMYYNGGYSFDDAICEALDNLE